MLQKKTCMRAAGIGAVWMLAALLVGCSAGRTDTEAGENTGEAQASFGTETTTELITELYEIETETDFFGEVQMRSIWEVMPDETRLWAASFDASQVEKVVYTTYMEEEPESYEITSRSKIRALFEAIDLIEAGGAVTAPSSLGDVFTFVMKDGTEQKFAFSLTCIVSENAAYETSGSSMLWELTEELIFGESSTETEY